MMARHECGLEHDMPQQMPPATGGPFSTQCTAVTGNFHAPVPRAIGARPVRAAACLVNIWPSPDISAISIVLTTGPILGTDPRIWTVLARASSPAISHSI